MIRKLAVLAGLLGLFAAVAAWVQMPGASGAFVAKVSNSGDSAGTNPYFTCTAAAVGETATKAYFAYALGETAGITAADASGNGRIGTYSLTGVSYGGANTTNCPRDGKSVITLDGANGYVSGPVTTQTNLNTFSIEIWFRTSSPRGLLIGWGTSRTGLSSQYDRHLYLDTSGHVIFGVYPGTVKTVNSAPASSTNYADGKWHYAVGTLSSAGMVLYVDGVKLSSDTSVTTAETDTGYWRMGYDNLNGWDTSANGSTPASTTGTNFYFAGNLAFAAEYNYALSATQVAQHYAAGR